MCQGIIFILDTDFTQVLQVLILGKKLVIKFRKWFCNILLQFQFLATVISVQYSGDLPLFSTGSLSFLIHYWVPHSL